MKIDMTKKYTKLIVTLVILLGVAFVGVWTSIKFTQFRNYETEFVLRDNVDEVLKFSEFSKNLKGTIGDSNIYVINGSENTVAVVKQADSAKYSTVESLKNVKVAAVLGSSQETAAKETLSKVESYANKDEALAALNNNTCEALILGYAEAKAIVKANSSLVISDAEVEKVPSLLVIGGTHPNEPSGQLTATIFLENAVMTRGTLYVITELNRSAYSFSQPQEATTWYYSLTTKSGKTRTFKYGSRATNTVDQWPTPDVYTHSSGQQLSSSEVRNINRAYPGSETGTYTEQIAYAVTNFVNTKDVTMVIDLHEASPEYLTINACVYHQDAAEIINKARSGSFRYETSSGKKKLDISFDESPTYMHGLTHRELGDYTNAYVFLFETSNASQGKLRGAFTESLITYSKEDKFYEAAVQYDEEHGTQLIYGRPVNIDERVARHTLSIISVINGFNKVGVTRTVTVTGRDNVGEGGVTVGEFIIDMVPEYSDIIANGVGYYLLDVE